MFGLGLRGFDLPTGARSAFGSKGRDGRGRGTLIGPIIGAFVVNGAKSWLTVAYPEFWLYFLGLLFIGVTLFLPDGIVGLVKKLRGVRDDA